MRLAVHLQKLNIVARSQLAANPKVRKMSMLIHRSYFRNSLTSTLKILLLASCWITLYLLNEKIWVSVLFELFAINPTSRAGGAVHFFFVDSVKILLLLAGITYVVTFIRSYLSLERTRAFLGGKRAGFGNLLAASAGVVTPFCSCSAVPVFMGFLSSGVPIGVTLSFLIASPLVNEIAIGLLFTMFGWKIAAIYLVSGLALAVIAGIILGKLKVEKWVEPFVLAKRQNQQLDLLTENLTIEIRSQIAFQEVKSTVRKIWPYLLIGIGVGAAIHGWLPTEFFARFGGEDNPFSVLVAVIAGIPLYSNAAGVMPVIETLYAKGLPIGTLLSFMMSVVALSLPEMILLKQVLKMKLLAIYVLIVGFGIIFIGYMFNAIL